MRRLDDFFHSTLHHGRCHHRGGGIGAHAAGVGAGVAITHALVVLGCCQRQRGFAIGKAEETGFLTVEESFHHNLGAGSAKSAVETVVDGGKRFRLAHGNRYALAGGKPVGLDDDGCALFTDILLCGFGGLETLISPGWNIVTGA